jgi:hypothetical protein
MSFSGTVGVQPSDRLVLETQRHGLSTPSFARDAWRNIPTVVEAMRQFWMPSRFGRRK